MVKAKEVDYTENGQNNVEEWCGADLQKLSHAAQNKNEWRDIVKRASDTYGHCAHGF